MNPNHFTRAYTHSPSEIAKNLPFYVHRAGWKAQKPGFVNTRKENEFYDYQLQYIVKGTCHLDWNGTTYHMKPGEMFFIDLSKEHSYSSDKLHPSEVIWIHFGGAQAQTYYQLVEGLGPIFQSDNPQTMGRMFRELVYLFNERPLCLDLYVSGLITSILTNLAVYALQGGSSHPDAGAVYTDKINNAIAFMEKEYQSNLRIEDIAKAALLSPYHFSRIFKQSTGFTIKEYLIKFRLTQAKYLLANTDLSQTEIAAQVGFTDQSYLGRVFRKYEKTTPLQYRRHVADRL
ncbi:MAG: transcriptional regulator, AraC family [Paenibacillaceae bacterium]|jgi:AraC-like DNA-binding protein|nr:transcriptional regulator, AraC family [Paenibacillaceae bacterium]